MFQIQFKSLPLASKNNKKLKMAKTKDCNLLWIFPFSWDQTSTSLAGFEILLVIWPLWFLTTNNKFLFDCFYLHFWTYNPADIVLKC